jgi:uncharacterized protein YkwD
MPVLQPLLRRALILVAIAAIGLGSAACEPQANSVRAASTGSSSEAGQLLSLVNGYRAANGLPGLTPAADATAKAQQHSNDMAGAGSLFHSSSLTSGIAGGWTALGENVGDGGAIAQIESMFEASGPHRANLLNGAYDQIGLGVAHSANGTTFITEIFVAR